MNEIALLFAAGPLIVVPLGLRLLPALRRPRRGQQIAVPIAVGTGTLLMLSFTLPTGAAAAALALPWTSLTVVVALISVGWLVRLGRPMTAADLAAVAAGVFLSVAGAFAVQDRAGWWWPPELPAVIVRLTAVHFTFAGFALVLVASMTARAGSRVASAGAVALIVGIPITALGFLGVPAASTVGAVVVSGGGLAVAAGLVLLARASRGVPQVLFRVAAGSLAISMPLALAYATGQATGLDWLDIPWMARVHGTLNVLGFAVPAMIGWTMLEKGNRLPAS